MRICLFLYPTHTQSEEKNIIFQRFIQYCFSNLYNTNLVYAVKIYSICFTYVFYGLSSDYGKVFALSPLLLVKLFPFFLYLPLKIIEK